MRIAFVSASSHFDVRFTKIATTVRQAGHDLVLIGLDRDPEVGVPSPPDGVVIRLLARQIPTRGALLRAVPAFARHVARQLRQVNPDVVYCRDEEGVMFALAARLLGCGAPPIICDLYDSLPLRVSGNLWYLPRVTVLPNYPRLSDAVHTGTFPSGPTRILVAGQLLPQRGLGQLLDACQGLKGIELWCAGQAISPWVREVFLRSPLTRYFGLLPQPRVLALTEACDAVFCFYEPLTPNDINASPNKLYDAMMVLRGGSRPGLRGKLL